MTGLLSRLAARGTGQAVAGGPARLTSPAQPRFTMPEAGESLEFEQATEGSPHRGPEQVAMRAEVLRREPPLTEDRMAGPENPLRGGTMGTGSQPLKVTREQPPSTFPARESGADQTEATPHLEQNSTPQTADAGLPSPSKLSGLGDHSPRPFDPNGQRQGPAPEREMTPPSTHKQVESADPGATELVEQGVESEISSASTGDPTISSVAPPTAPSSIPLAALTPFPTDQPGPRLSIGRIDVIFESPEPPPSPRHRPTPERTRGFDSYSNLRLGRRR